MLFVLCLISSILYPIIQVKQWKQLGIIVNLALLAAANGCFYFGATGLIDQGAFIGIQGGLFLIVGLILFMGRCWVPLDYVDTRSRRLLESRRFLHDLTLALRRP